MRRSSRPAATKRSRSTGGTRTRVEGLIGSLDEGDGRLAAAFDTRVHASPVLTGRPRRHRPAP